MSTIWSLLVSLFLLAFNGFFVAAEFALVAAKRHRLEQLAAEGSRGARFAIAGVSELSMMLAGAQLGITLCTLGLGALAKPAVAHLLEPTFATFGVPQAASYVVAFVLAVSLVGFLHVVIGEMAPKSWAISHPEKSALLLAVPFRAFTRVTRPLLTVLNGMANVCLRLVKVTPQDELAQVHGPQELRMLIRSAKEHGTLAALEHDLLIALLDVQRTTVAQVMVPPGQIVTVDAAASVRSVELTSRREGRSRLAVVSGNGKIVGLVHVRDAVRATTAGTPATAADLVTPLLTLPATTPVATAVRTMRNQRAQLALVVDRANATVGLVALEDLLEEIIGEFDDETDAIPAAILQARQAGNPL